MARAFRIEVLDQHGSLVSIPARNESFLTVQLRHAEVKRHYAHERQTQGWRVRSVPEDQCMSGSDE